MSTCALLGRARPDISGAVKRTITVAVASLAIAVDVALVASSVALVRHESFVVAAGAKRRSTEAPAAVRVGATGGGHAVVRSCAVVATARTNLIRLAIAMLEAPIVAAVSLSCTKVLEATAVDARAAVRIDRANAAGRGAWTCRTAGIATEVARRRACGHPLLVGVGAHLCAIDEACLCVDARLDEVVAWRVARAIDGCIHGHGWGGATRGGHNQRQQ